jgi:hypothetical protein
MFEASEVFRISHYIVSYYIVGIAHTELFFWGLTSINPSKALHGQRGVFIYLMFMVAWPLVLINVIILFIYFTIMDVLNARD